jgi:hypothetical protein
MNIDKGLFKAGNNVLAVEVHQVGAESSDVSFDLSLDALVYGAQTTEELQGDTQSFLVQNSFEIEPIYIEKSCATGLKINELVASNNTLPDAFGEKGDWFEVHNTTNADINMAGMWLTDNFSRKNKYEIPQNQADKTTVPAHGFLVFWADEAIWKDASHTNFKLEASGERVGIYQFCKADTVLIDTMSYKNLNTNWSLGRFPDGTSNIILMPVSSPLSANIQSAIPLGIAAVTPWVTIYPNPNAGVFRLACSEFGKPLQLRIWNSQGVCVFTQIIMPEQVIDVSQLGSGLYFFDFGTGDTKLTQRILIMKP